MTDIGRLQREIYATIRYHDLFDQPITSVQIWRSLIISEHAEDNSTNLSSTSGQRWGGQKIPSFAEISGALDTSEWLRLRIQKKFGYYFLRGRSELVSLRLSRHRLAQMKWKLTKRIVRWLTLAPFVKMLAMSGSLAAGNTRPGSDLDLFIVVKSGRIWTARLGLLFISQILGRRRKYWQGEAPDKVCLNHYVTTQSLLMPKTIRNLYTALLYRNLIPLTGIALSGGFFNANAAWIKHYLMYPSEPHLPSRHVIKRSKISGIIQSQLESLLSEPVFSLVELWAEKVQRRSILRHTKPAQSGRVVMSATELAFHPDTKVPGILAKFSQDEGQKKLL